jgi:hypothetical protein
VSIEKIIADTAGRIDAETATALLHRGLTLDGRVEWNAALAALSPAESHACKCVTAQGRMPSLSVGNLSLAFRPHGRLYLLLRETYEAHVHSLTLLCHVELDCGDLETYHALRRSAHNALQQEREEICADLREQGFEVVCSELGSVVEHMAPLIYYIGERCISNFYNVGKSGYAPEMTLADALQHVVEQREHADIEVLTAVHCLHLILRSGSYTRLEELNASQLTRRTVEEFFDTKAAFYEETCDCAVEKHFASATLREKAALLARMRETIATRKRFIRLINGTNVRKREAVLPLPPPSALAASVPVNPSANVEAILQRCLPQGSSVQRLFSAEFFEHLLEPVSFLDAHASLFDSTLEYLLDRVVAEAVQATNSDIGMTRSARDYRRFAEAVRGRQTIIASGWSQAEYFCHVVPSSGVLKTFSSRALVMTLNAISARMRFNSWHYAPSYFDVAAVPEGRGWFTAPRMADIADDSDQHHTGHMHAVVRYSIRSPLPIRIGQDVLPGFIDLRLMRQSGAPYGQAELMTAIAYTEVLQFIYQHLMNRVLARNVGFVFSFGDKKWFDRMHAALTPQMPQPASIAQSLPPQPKPADALAIHA